MDQNDSAYHITDVEGLEQMYGQPSVASIKKEINYLHPHYRTFIEAAPFALLATCGPQGLDVSPRGDPAGFVQVVDDKTLLLPDRRGNNRLDSLKNIIANPRVALIFLIPGVGETLRINGRGRILVHPDLLSRFSMDGKAPISVLEVKVESAFIQCSQAILRSRIWDQDQRIDRNSLPSTGTILEDVSRGEINGEQYDAGLSQRMKSTMY